jgi:hypothetical protein
LLLAFNKALEWTLPLNDVPLASTLNLQAAAVSFANIMLDFEQDKQPELEDVTPPFNIFRITPGIGPQPNRGRLLGGVS